jgi:hypothetical protein
MAIPSFKDMLKIPTLSNQEVVDHGRSNAKHNEDANMVDANNLMKTLGGAVNTMR